MRAEYDDYFSSMALLKKKDLSPEKKMKVYNQLRQRLADWGTHTWHEKSFEWWQLFDAHGTLPFSGAYEDQPRYVQLDLLRWTQLQRFWEINSELPDVSALPSLSQLE